MSGFHRPDGVYHIEDFEFYHLMTLLWVWFLDYPQRYLIFYRTVSLDPKFRSVVLLSFWGCFECLPHKLKDIVCTSLCKLHIMIYIHLCRHMLLFNNLENIFT